MLRIKRPTDRKYRKYLPILIINGKYYHSRNQSRRSFFPPASHSSSQNPQFYMRERGIFNCFKSPNRHSRIIREHFASSKRCFIFRYTYRLQALLSTKYVPGGDDESEARQRFNITPTSRVQEWERSGACNGREEEARKRVFRATERGTSTAILGGGGARIWQLGSPLFALLGHGPFHEHVSSCIPHLVAFYPREIFAINIRFARIYRFVARNFRGWLAVTRGFSVTPSYLCRELHSLGAACSTTSPPAVRYTVFPVSNDRDARPNGFLFLDESRVLSLLKYISRKFTRRTFSRAITRTIAFEIESVKLHNFPGCLVAG